jgi:hypothetical protein
LDPGVPTRACAQVKESIAIPLFKEWTGTGVRERVENIEHVYKELTAGG